MAKFKQKDITGGEPVIVDAWLIGMITGWLKSDRRELPEPVNALIESGYIIPGDDELHVEMPGGTVVGKVEDWLVIVGAGQPFVIRDSNFHTQYVICSAAELGEKTVDKLSKSE